MFLLKRSFWLQCKGRYAWKWKVKVAQSCPTLCDFKEFSRPEYWSRQPFPFPGESPNPGIRTHVFPIAGGFLNQLSHKGNPRILEWVAYTFCSGSSWPRNWTRVSCIVGGFFTNWAIREALIHAKLYFSLSHFLILTELNTILSIL